MREKLNRSPSVNHIKTFDLSLSDLLDQGWQLIATSIPPSKISECMLDVARSLGEIAPGRKGRLVEEVIPEDLDTARPGSLSSIFGLDSLPLHTETAHWNVPCRYLLLACADIGAISTPTLLLDSRAADLTSEEKASCKSSSFLIKNGRYSFYGSILENNRPFIRFDPGCMSPLTGSGQNCLDAFRFARQEALLKAHEWSYGEILVIDNWRMLHGRGLGQPTKRGRVLLRVMVR